MSTTVLDLLLSERANQLAVAGNLATAIERAVASLNYTRAQHANAMKQADELEAHIRTLPGGPEAIAREVKSAADALTKILTERRFKG